jgi:hypothetical protein
MSKPNNTVGLEAEIWTGLTIAAAEETMKQGKRVSARALASRILRAYLDSRKAKN